jgi:hypothetical protein
MPLQNFETLWHLLDYASLQTTTWGHVRGTQSDPSPSDRSDRLSALSAYSDIDIRLPNPPLASPMDGGWDFQFGLGDDLSSIWSEMQ